MTTRTSVLRTPSLSATQQQAKLTLGYHEYLLPIEHAHAIQRAMMHAVKVEESYNSNKTYSYLMPVTALVDLYTPKNPVYDCRALTLEQRDNWHKAVKEATEAGTPITDVITPEEFARATQALA